MKRHTAVSLAATFTLLCCSILPVGAYDMGSPEEPLRLSAGLSHTVYVDETGTLWAWGSNQAGQLGTETQETSTDLEGNPIPYASQPLAVMEGVVSASAGADFTVALKADGTLWTWGGNDEGQLGTGTTEGSTTPVQVLDQVTAVVAGDYHVAALRTDGTLWTWGDNLYGQLGDGTYTSRPTPAQVMEGVTTVAAGVGATAAICTDSTLWTWGDNLFGQLGDGTQDSRPTPQQILTDVSAVNLGGYHAAAIRTDGTLWMWGSNIDGQLGTGQATEVLQTQPVQVPLNGAVLAVAAGTGHTVAILEDGSLWVWGRNDQGQLGLDPDTAALVPQPTQVTEATGAVDVAAGTYQTACLLSDGTLLTWGAQRLLGSGSVEAWAETATEDTTAQVTLSQEAGWAPWAVLAGSVVCLLAAGLVTRPRRDWVSVLSKVSGFSLRLHQKGVYLLAQSCKSMGGLCHGTLSPCRSAPGRPRQPGLDPGPRLCPGQLLSLSPAVLRGRPGPVGRGGPRPGPLPPPVPAPVCQP